MERKRYPLLVVLLMGVLVCAQALVTPSATSAAASLALTQLSGRVYEGDHLTEPPVATGLGGVTVTLYGATQPGTTYGDVLDTATTDSNGWYQLEFNEFRYTYYNIVETNLGPYHSVGASSVSGTVRDDDWIQYTAPISGQTTTGNKFWDLPRTTRTPTHTKAATLTHTVTPRPTQTPTHTRIPPTWTPTGTGVATPTRTGVATPTPTRTRVDTPTPTRPSGETPTPTPTGGAVATATLPAGCDYLHPDFSWSPDPPCRGVAVYFSDWSTTSATDPIVAWSWNLGNGFTTTVQNPVTLYGLSDPPGPYTVLLEVTTQSGCRSRVAKRILVLACDWLIHKVCVGPQAGPIHVGDPVTCTLTVTNTGSSPWAEYELRDTYPTGELDYVSASPPPTQPILSWKAVTGQWMGTVTWHVTTPLAPGQGAEYAIVFRARAVGKGVCDVAELDYWLANGLRMAGGRSQFCLDIVAREEQRFVLSKARLDPASGVAHPGEVVHFGIGAQNQGTATESGFRVEDTFLDAEYDFLSAVPPPSANTSDGTTHTLIWQNIILPPGGIFTATIELRAKLPGVVARNCATLYYHSLVPGTTFTSTLLTPLGPACAEFPIEALPGRHVLVTKKWTNPTNHVANLHDWVDFTTIALNTGTEDMQQTQVVDHITPPGVTWILPYSFTFTGPYASGKSTTLAAMFTADALASPAINTAEWTITWPDGTVETQTASDYLYIVDGQAGTGLFIDKWLAAPPGAVAISDTLIYHIAITNVTGADLPVVSLQDVFPAACLSFLWANPLPDSVGPGTLTWNNVGPLALGDSVTIDVRFHADAVCPNGLNCASATYLVPGTVPQTVADCAPATIEGERPRLEVTKRRISPSPALVGDPVTWDIVLRNAGTAPLPVVPLHDGYQAAFLEFDSAMPPPDGIDLPNGRLDWANVGPLAPGQTRTVTVRLRAIAPAPGALNCAESTYTVGSGTFTPHGCDSVDIRAPGPALRAQKALAWPLPSSPLAMGDVAAFTLTVHNAGPVTLTHVVVEDHFDPGCWTYIGSPGMPPTFPAPGVLRWDLPDLAPGEVRSWQVLLRAIAPCAPTENCIVATASSPEGLPVHAEDCALARIEAPRPGLELRKALVAPAHVPLVGDVVQFELVVRNTGNTTLMVVEVVDSYDTVCLKYVNAVPAPDSVDLAAGQMHWNNVGPLAPGDVRVLNVFLAAIHTCAQATNCADARWLVAGVPERVAHDCATVPVRSAAQPTPTPTGGAVATPTGSAVVTATPTRPAAATPTPTEPKPPGEQRLFLPIVLKRWQ